MVAIFNLNRSVEVGNLLSSVPTDDVLRVDSIPCVARVQVSTAYFRVPYNGAKGIPAPCMAIEGDVTELFIEDYDDRMFPCGSKSMELMQPEHVKVDYQICPDELAVLAGKGLFHDKDFAVPPGLVGNIIEIPCDITYCGIYDTLVGSARINNALDLRTDKWRSGYVTLFDTCKQSERAAQITRGELSMQDELREPDLMTAVGYEPVAQDDGELRASNRMASHETEDARIAKEVAQRIDKRAKEAADNREAMKGDSTATDMLEAAHREKDAIEKAQERDVDIFGQAKHQSSERATKLYDLLKQKAQQPAQPEEARPETPLDGYAQTESVVSNPLKGDKDKDEERQNKSGKKGTKVAQQVDIAMDNQALNRGETDIAGQGAGSEITSKREQERIASTEGIIQQGDRSNDSERFL